MKGSVRRELFFDSAESEALGMCGNSMRENRETLQTPTLNGSVGRSKKAKGRNVDMHVCGESDGLIVPTKRANKVDAYALAAESAEERRPTKGNALQAYLRRCPVFFQRDKIEGRSESFLFVGLSLRESGCWF